MLSSQGTPSPAPAGNISPPAPCPGCKPVWTKVRLTDSTARQAWRMPGGTLGWQEGTALQGE